MTQLRSVSLALFYAMVFGAASLLAQRTVTVPESVVAYPDIVVYNGKVVTMDDTSFGGKIIVMRDEFTKELGRSAVGPQIVFDNKARYASSE